MLFIISAVLMFALLVLVHEAGHFLTAKALGVKCEVFSIGFGPKLLSYQWGETRYQLAAIPLGGYVKITGQEESDEVDEEEVNLFHEKPLWIRIAVVAAGPLASILFPILIYFAVFLTITEDVSSRIGEVLPGSAAAEAGLQSGDVIKQIDGEPVYRWTQILSDVGSRAEKPITVVVDRMGQELSLTLTPKIIEEKDQIGKIKKRAVIGVTNVLLESVVGARPQSPAAKAGVKLGERVTALNGQPIKYMYELNAQLDEIAQSGRPFKLSLTPAPSHAEKSPDAEASQSDVQARELTIIPEKQGDTWFVGLEAASSFIGSVEEDSPAAKAGLKAGDRLLGINGSQQATWSALVSELRSSPEQPIELTVERLVEKQVEIPAPAAQDTLAPSPVPVPDQAEPAPVLPKVTARVMEPQTVTVSVTQEKEEVMGQFKQKVTQYRFGAKPAVALGSMASFEYVEIDNLLVNAMQSTWREFSKVSLFILSVLAGLFQGKVPFNTLGGPIMIFDVAGTAAQQGLGTYLFVMAMISINLGLLNLLPIPVLDGGHLVFFAIEGLIRRPLNQRLKERVTMAGFALLMTFMAVVIFNDLRRYLFPPDLDNPSDPQVQTETDAP